MKFSTQGMDLLKRAEGFRCRVYLDVVGVPTIGYGHRLLPGESFPSGIDEAQASQILAGDLGEAETAIARLVKVSLTQGQFDALVDFVFNLGADRLATSTLLVDLNHGQYEDAVAQLLRWDHAGSKELTALKTRREAEAALWRGSSQSVAA
jgi:lysozyme